jgi:hypothetical protein
MSRGAVYCGGVGDCQNCGSVRQRLSFGHAGWVTVPQSGHSSSGPTGSRHPPYRGTQLWDSLPERLPRVKRPLNRGGGSIDGGRWRCCRHSRTH